MGNNVHGAMGEKEAMKSRSNTYLSLARGDKKGLSVHLYLFTSSWILIHNYISPCLRREESLIRRLKI